MFGQWKKMKLEISLTLENASGIQMLLDVWLRGLPSVVGGVNGLEGKEFGS